MHSICSTLLYLHKHTYEYIGGNARFNVLPTDTLILLEFAVFLPFLLCLFPFPLFFCLSPPPTGHDSWWWPDCRYSPPVAHNPLILKSHSLLSIHHRFVVDHCGIVKAILVLRSVSLCICCDQSKSIF